MLAINVTPQVKKKRIGIGMSWLSRGLYRQNNYNMRLRGPPLENFHLPVVAYVQ